MAARHADITCLTTCYSVFLGPD